MLRVMMLTTDLERGGLPLRLVRLACQLRGFDVEPIVGCLAPPGPLTAELEAVGIETFACDAGGAFDVACIARLARHVRRIQPDLIHSSLFHANLAARLVGRLDRPRPVLTSTVTIEIERHWHRWLESLTAGASDLHVANSAAVARHVCSDLGFPSSRVMVIPNGLDIAAIDAAPAVRRRDHGIEEDVPLVVWAGRMDPVKDLVTLVGVIDRLRQRRVALRVVLIGDGPEREAISAMIRRRRLDGVIDMALWSENVPGWMKTADCLLFPSRTEGSPNVVIEAMLCGCPVVASDIPAVRELVGGEAGALLCRAGDIAGFAAATEAVLLDADIGHRLAATGRALAVERHNIQHVVGQWRGAYDRLISRGSCAT